MSKKDDEISVQYLFNMCNRNKKLSCMRQSHQKQLEGLIPLIEQVKTWRDLTIAHLDKKHVNDPSTIAKMQPVDMENVGEGFILLVNIRFGYL